MQTRGGPLGLQTMPEEKEAHSISERHKKEQESLVGLQRMQDKGPGLTALPKEECL